MMVADATPVGFAYTEISDCTASASSRTVPPRKVAPSRVMLARSGESASSKTVPPAKPLLPSAVSIAPCCRVMFCASNVISPEAAIELSLRCAVALVALATTRLDTVTFEDKVILSSACKVRLPAFQLVPPPEVPPSAFAPSLRSKSAEITIFCGSIRMSP